MPDIKFDISGARNAGATDSDISKYFKDKYGVDFDIAGAKQSGASDSDILNYINSKYSDGSVKKKEPSISKPSSIISDLSSTFKPVSKNPNAEKLYESKVNKDSAKILTENIKAGKLFQPKPTRQEIYNVDPTQYVQAVKKQQEQDVIAEQQLALQQGLDTPNFYVYEGNTYPKSDYFKYQNILIPRKTSTSLTAYTNDARKALVDNLVKPIGGLLSAIRDGSNVLGKNIYESFDIDYVTPPDPSSPEYKENWLTDPIGKAVKILNETSETADYLQGKEGLPESSVAKSLIHAAPLIGIMYATGGARAGSQLAAEAGALGEQTLGSIALKQIANPLTKTLTAQGALSSYNEAKKQGKDTPEAFSEALMGGVEGAKGGITLTAQMGLAHGLTKDIIQMGVPLTAKQVEMLGVGTVFGGTSIANDLIEGKDIDIEKAWHEFLVGAAFEAPKVLGEGYTSLIKEPLQKANINRKSFAQAIQTKQGAKIIDATLNANAINNFFNSKPEAIDIAMSVESSPKKLWNKAIKFGERAYDSKDLAEKNSNYANQLTMQKIADIKYVADAVVNNKQGFVDAVNKMTDLSAAEKADYIERINDVYNRYSQDGRAKSVIDASIEALNGEIRSLEIERNKSKSPSERVEIDTLIKSKQSELAEIQKSLEEYSSEKIADDQAKTDLANTVELVDDFVERYTSGEDMTSPEDIQFYKDNAELIESKLKDYAVQEQTTGEVPVQPEARVGEKVAEGKPEAKPEEVTEVKEEVIKRPDSELFKNKVNESDVPTLKSKGSDFSVLYVPRKVVELAYENDEVNKNRTGGPQSLDTIVRRGGYSIEELNKLLPNWRDIAIAERGLIKEPAIKVEKTNLDLAKEKLAAAKKKLSDNKVNLGIYQDPKKKAKDLFEYHGALVEVAKEYINQGVKNVKDFAKEIGEDLTTAIQNAWDEASGAGKKTVEDFINFENKPLVGITKRDVSKLREELGEEQFEYETQTMPELARKAAEDIERGFDVPNLIKKINDGVKKSVEDIDVERIKQYYASLTAAINKNPTPELLQKRRDVLAALDIVKLSAGRAVKAFDGFVEAEDNLSKFLSDEAAYSDLTQAEINELTKKYNEAQEINNKLKERMAILEADAANKQANQKIAEIKAKQRKASLAAKKADFKKERQQYVEAFRERLKQIRTSPQVTIVPYQAELIELAPFVKNMVKSYVKEGIVELKDIVDNIHEQFKDDIEGLTPEDIRDIIAGKYVNPKETKNAKLALIRDLTSQAKLEIEIENLKQGIEKEKKPVQKKVKSDKLIELEDELRDIKRRTKEENAPSKLDKKKQWYKNKIEKLKEQIANGDFAEVEPPAKITLDNEALRLKDEYIKFLTENRERRDAKEREAMSKLDKALDKIEQVTGLKRIVQTSIDLSIPLRQGVSVMLNPRTAKIGADAYVKMIKSVFNVDGKGLAKFKFDDKFYNRLMFDIEKSPNYLESKEDGVVYNEVGAMDPEKRGEFHPSDNFIYRIPYLSAPFKASERAAAAWSNVARFELYNRGVKLLLSEGKTRENSPKAYQDLAARIMVDTGKAKLPWINDKSPNVTDKKIKWALSKTMYGARLFASNIRKLNPLYYLNPKVDRTVRKEAFKDMIGYVSSQVIANTAIAYALGARVSLDPDDSDFMKVRIGKKVIDLTAGQGAYIRTFLRLVKASYLQSDPTVSKEDADSYSRFAAQSLSTFFRNKLAPNTSYAVSAFMGSNSIGEKFDPYEIIKLYPMYADDLIDAFNESSYLDAAIVLPIGILGLSYQEYSKDVRQAKINDYITDSDTKLKNFLEENKLNIKGDINQEIYNPKTKSVESMDRSTSDKFERIWSEYVIDGLKEAEPEIRAMKKDIFSSSPDTATKLKLKELASKSENKDLTEEEIKQKLYDSELKKKITSIKSDATELAKDEIIGFPDKLRKVKVKIKGEEVEYTLNEKDLEERVKLYKDYLKDNRYLYTLDYNQYISDGYSPAKAKKLATKSLRSDAIKQSSTVIDKYYDETTEQYKF